MKWYAVYVQTGREEQVRTQLYKQLDYLHCCIPKRKIHEKKEGVFREVTRIMFPGYVFVYINMDADKYTGINSIYGVFKILDYCNEKDKKIHCREEGSEGDYFKCVPIEEIEPILELINGEDIIELSKAVFVDNKLYILSGPLKGKENRITKLDKRHRRAKINFEFMGASKIIDLGIEFESSPTRTGG
ncbi:antiterminator LoaP [Paenibacillus sp. FSL H8-0048]|uniref:antiterminator LoaP n=1 Tax=Paenibacillus sp. FSL H8-0048 TaxID=2954508 RepID=UPI0030F597F9